MPEEIIQVENEYYILATSSRADDRERVIKQGDTFGVFDNSGAIRTIGMGEQGIYHDGTRFLNRFEITLHGRRLQPLRSTVRADHALVVELTNPDYLDMPEPLPRELVHITFKSFLFDGAWYGRITVHNFAMRAVAIDLSLRFAADYVDIFEIRGMTRPRRGAMHEPRVEDSRVVLGYEGLDRVARTTNLTFSPKPRELTTSMGTWALELPPRGEQVIEFTAAFRTEPADTRHRDPMAFDHACHIATNAIEALAPGATLEASNARMFEWIDRSSCDLLMMLTPCSHGAYPYAGVPWFSTVFGRDGIVTALETLWLDPSVARGVLGHLAATQAALQDPANDAEPGKIVHETRRGEMAALREIPFGRYYGSVDATPLFIALAGAYFRRTGDLAFVEMLWPHIERALAWIATDGDPDRDGFVEYARRSEKGLVSQGWKDSADSISHRDGMLAEGPIALCEVQGYVYAAYRAASILASALNKDVRAVELATSADDLRKRFDRAFWCEEIGTYCLALDGAKRQCAVRASNAGHVLLAGIASTERANRVCESLMSPHMFSGWGIRTLDEREVRYNPMSYHNGSVWPHDNAVAALGMARYGFKEHALAVLDGMYQASISFDVHRIPELFCGFSRAERDEPTPYPVACSPQAWAAGSVFMLLQACLGVDIDAPRQRLRFVRPVLPENVDRLGIKNLRVGNAVVDLVVHRTDRHIGINLERSDGEIDVVVVKRGV
jgi:glycogen debranching enzyme